MYPTLQAAGELAVNYSELSGGYNNYPLKFIDESVAFAVTWIYCIEWLSTFALELVTASITIRYWDGDQKINPDVWVTIIVFRDSSSSSFCRLQRLTVKENLLLDALKFLWSLDFLLCPLLLMLVAVLKENLLGDNTGMILDIILTSKVYVRYLSLVRLLSVNLNSLHYRRLNNQTPARAIPTACQLVFWRIFYIIFGFFDYGRSLVPNEFP